MKEHRAVTPSSAKVVTSHAPEPCCSVRPAPRHHASAIIIHYCCTALSVFDVSHDNKSQDVKNVFGTGSAPGQMTSSSNAWSQRVMQR